MAEGGRIEPGPAAPAAGPRPAARHARPGDLASQEQAAVSDQAAQLLAFPQPVIVTLANSRSCNCPECQWLRSALALLAAVAR